MESGTGLSVGRWASGDKLRALSLKRDGSASKARVRASEPVSIDAVRWNHNIHYHSMILGALGSGRGRVLDVGYGEGILARELLQIADHATAIDLDRTSCRPGSTSGQGQRDRVPRRRFPDPSFRTASFDAIVSVAALHHMDAGSVLGRMRQLLRPAGTLAIVGLARSRVPADLPLDLAAVVVNLAHKARKPYWEHSAPTVWAPPARYADMRRTAAQELPGVRYRRHLLWRYSLVWTKPKREASR